jgi:hypothetical protein
VKVSRHARERMDERAGLSASASVRLAGKALADGLHHNELAGSLKRYIDGMFLRHCAANNIRLYGEYVYLFGGETLITVIHLPNHYKAAVNKIQRRKRTAA